MLYAHVWQLRWVTFDSYTLEDKAQVFALCRPLIDKIEAWRKENKFLFDTLCWLDFIYFEAIETANWLSDNQLYQNSRNLLKFFEAITSLPNLKEAWLDDGKLMKYPFNSRYAKLGGIDSPK